MTTIDSEDIDITIDSAPIILVLLPYFRCMFGKGVTAIASNRMPRIYEPRERRTR